MSFKSVSVATATLAGVLAVAGSASAQISVSGSVGVGVQTQPVYVQPQPVYVQQPQPVYVQQPQPVYVQQPQPVYMMQPQEDYGRFRFGVDAGGGGLLLSNGLSGAAINFGLRLGWQLNHPFAVYYQGNLPIGFASGQVGGASYGGASIWVQNTIAFEYTLLHFLHLGIGPSLDYGLAAVCRSGGGCLNDSGAFFGFNGRIAITLGGVRPGRRVGFSLGLDLHTTFATENVYFFSTLGLGVEYY